MRAPTGSRNFLAFEEHDSGPFGQTKPSRSRSKGRLRASDPHSGSTKARIEANLRAPCE